jgi:hypothetical protein
MSEQTAVEWLVETLEDNGISLDLASEIIEEAKELEKQQIEDAWNSAYGGDSNHEGEQYYKETYQDTK